MVADETLKAKPEIFHSDHKITKNAKTWGNHNKHNIHKYSPRTINKLHRFVLTYDTIDLLVPWISVVTQEEIVKCVCVGWESDREKKPRTVPSYPRCPNLRVDQSVYSVPQLTLPTVSPSCYCLSDITRRLWNSADNPVIIWVPNMAELGFNHNRAWMRWKAAQFILISLWKWPHITTENDFERKSRFIF